MKKELERIKTLLSTDRLSHLSHLKMIEEYEDSIEYSLIEQKDSWGVLLSIPVASSSFDAEMYPQAKYVIYLAGSGDSEEHIVQELIGQIPTDVDLVFKIHKSFYKQRIESQYPLIWKRAYLSYSCPGYIQFDVDPEVVTCSRLDDRLLPLWVANGYWRNDIENYFNKGARSFSIFKEGIPVSTCLIYHNSSSIWEVGAVHTMERERGKGYARKIVGAALNEIIKAGIIPRYQVVHSNIPSIRLAESLGLELFLKLEHYYYKAGN